MAGWADTKTGAAESFSVRRRINDHSQTVANAYDTATNQTHALLLTPADNPAWGHRMTGDL